MRENVIQNGGVNEAPVPLKRLLEGKMTDKQAFYAMYLILYKYYNDGFGRKSDSLGLEDLLSSMDPTFFSGGPADVAYFRDWQRILSDMQVGDRIEGKTLLEAVKRFTNEYISEFDFDLGVIPEKLQSVTFDDRDLQEAIERAREVELDWWRMDTIEGGGMYWMLPNLAGGGSV